ncbi:MAG: hypothetical protein H0U86_10760 [Chloroflexi bacterium]|nr:hypothetical protein [Chloroflexota bacterium]
MTDAEQDFELLDAFVRWSYRGPEDGRAPQRALDALARLRSLLLRAEGREGMVTVYDYQGRYVGCMGRETWEEMLAEKERL